MIGELKKEGLFLSNGLFNPSYVKKFTNSLTPERQTWFDATLGDSLSEKVYIIIHNLSNKPVCKQCSAPVKFISFGEGYREYCCATCRAKGCNDQAKKTNLERYGVAHPAQTKSVQDKMKTTTMERYGVENIFMRRDIIQEAVKQKYGITNINLLPEIKEKVKRTNLERYGVEYTQQNKEVANKTKQTNMDKYGNICSLHGAEISLQVARIKKDKYWEHLLHSNRLQSLVTPLFTREDYLSNTEEDTTPIYYPWKCNTCNTIFNHHLANGNIPRCPTCFPSEIQGALEKQVIEWIQTIAPTAKIVIGNRKIIPPLEIDIYLPEYNFAIEFDEVYWHCELSSKSKRDINYHLNKTLDCKKQGIELIHIFDSEWWNTQDIVKSIISSRLGIYERKIGARKCLVKEISIEESKQFLNDNHLQGYNPASYKYGLFYNNELVAHLAVAKNRFKKDTYEIVRYVSKINTSVQGGLSKLWKEIEKVIPKPFTLISYVDKRFFTGKSNEAIGLQYTHTNRPAYYYTKDYKILFNRMVFQKKNIKKNLPVYDQELTEWENMQLNKFDRIWDCGTDVFMKEFV